MKSFIPWVGGKSKLLWLIHKLSPSRYSRFIDVFGGSGTVTLSRPIQQGCMEVYNDFNGDLTNLFCCVKNRTMALLLELGFLPLNTRDDFNVLYKFFSRKEFTDDYLDEEMELTQRYLEPPDAKTIRSPYSTISASWDTARVQTENRRSSRRRHPSWRGSSICTCQVKPSTGSQPNSEKKISRYQENASPSLRA